MTHSVGRYFRKEKLSRAGESPDTKAVLYEKKILNVIQKERPSTASGSFFGSEVFQLGLGTLFEQNTVKR